MRRARDYKQRIISGTVPAFKYKPQFHTLFVVPNYRSVDGVKRRAGSLVETLSKGAIRKESITGSLQKGSSAKDLTGSQIGHGEYGAPVALIKTLKIEQALQKFGASPDALKQLASIKESYNITTEIDHSSVLSTSGTLKKGWTVVISAQSARMNQLDANSEGAFLNEVKKFYRDNVTSLEGSPSLKDSVESVMLGAIAPKNSKVISRNKPKKRVSTKGKGKSKKAVRENTPKIITGDISPEAQERNTPKPGRSMFSNEHILGMLNARINEKVASNMESPALNLRSGAFAASVRITDINRTRKGFPSIGYTYDKFPYQTFEPGYAQGSVERDPRRLIDRSIRELAVELAMGRFYTRRV
jgi:hypothetical protein